MSGNAFVVSDCLIVNQRALREIRCRHDHAAGPLTVRRPGDVVSGGGRLKRRNGFDRHRRFRQQGEQFRKLRLHLRDVMAEIIEDLLSGRRDVFRIGFERRAERREIVESFFLGDDSHLRLDAVDLAETQLMDLIRRHVRGCPAVDVVFVALLSVGQRGDRERRAALGRIFCANEGREDPVRSDHIGVDRVGDLLRQSLLIFGRNLRGIFFRRHEKRIGVDDALALHRNFLQQKPHRHQLVAHPGAQNFGGLARAPRNLLQPRDVVLVVLDGIERHGQRQIRQIGMDAILLIDRHLVFFEIEVGDALLQDANQQVVRKLILVGEAVGRDRLQPAEETPSVLCRCVIAASE